jgi:CheY-like chemotaxis protein
MAKRLLLINPNDFIRRLQKRTISGLGWQVDEATTAPEARHLLLGADNFSAVFIAALTDDGLGLARSIRREWPKSRIILQAHNPALQLAARDVVDVVTTGSWHDDLESALAQLGPV